MLEARSKFTSWQRWFRFGSPLVLPIGREPTVAISSPLTFPNVLHYWGKSLSMGGLVMRMIAALAVLSALLALGGCFHHAQVYTAEPQVLPPLK